MWSKASKKNYTLDPCYEHLYHKTLFSILCHFPFVHVFHDPQLHYTTSSDPLMKCHLTPMAGICMYFEV